MSIWRHTCCWTASTASTRWPWSSPTIPTLSFPLEWSGLGWGKQVGVFDPSRRRSFELHNAASWYRPLRRGPLSASLFPETLTDGQGTGHQAVHVVTILTRTIEEQEVMQSAPNTKT